MNIFDAAKQKCTQLAETLPAIDAACASAFERQSLSEAQIELAIEATWHSFVERAENRGVTYDYSFVHDVFSDLTKAAHASNYVADHGESPWEPANGRVDIDNLTIVYWDHVFPVMNLTLGWTCMNMFLSLIHI